MDIYTFNTYIRSLRPKKRLKVPMPSDYKKKIVIRKPSTSTYSEPYIGVNGHWYINGIDTGISAFSTDYNDLKNKPSLEGEVLQGNTELDVLSVEDIDQIINTEGD